MAAVALDMISLVKFLKNIGSEPLPRTKILESFLQSQELLTIETAVKDRIDVNWASEGFLLDMFRIVIARRYSQDGWDHKLKSRSENQQTFHPRRLLLEFTTFPGGESLNLGHSPIADAERMGLFGSLADMKASVIAAGPYQLILTSNPANHFTLNDEGKIRIFSEDPDKRLGVPGRTFRRYKSHTLGR